MSGGGRVRAPRGVAGDLRSVAQHPERPLARDEEDRIVLQHQAGPEHRRVGRGLPPGEPEIRLAAVLYCRHRIGPAAPPGILELGGKTLETLPRDLGNQRVAVTEMTIRGRGTYPGSTRDLGEGEPGRTALGDQLERGLHQGFAQVPVMIAFALPPSPAAHVKG